MESLAEFAFEQILSPVGLLMVAAVATATAVLSSGLAAFIVELSEAMRAKKGVAHDEPSSLVVPNTVVGPPNQWRGGWQPSASSVAHG